MTPIELILIRGASQTGKSTVARDLATRLKGKAAVIHVDDLLARWIVVHDPDLTAEEAMVYRQVRLLVSGYLRAGYHTVVEGVFAAVALTSVRDYAGELVAIRNLMSTIPGVRATAFTLTAPLDELRRRAGSADGLSTGRVDTLFAAYQQSELRDATVVDTVNSSVETVSERILAELSVVM